MGDLAWWASGVNACRSASWQHTADYFMALPPSIPLAVPELKKNEHLAHLRGKKNLLKENKNSYFQSPPPLSPRILLTI